MVIKFKSYNYQIIKLFLIRIVWPLVSYLNLFCNKPINLPLKKVRFTVKRSYHVTSKSKEHFAIHTYRVNLKIPLVLNQISKLKFFITYLSLNLKSGLSLKIVKQFN